MSGNVGLAVTQVISLIGMCNWGLRQTAELENQMTSVERIVEYTKLETEDEMSHPHQNQLTENWPQYGEIKFNNLSLKYSKLDEDLILKELTFTVKPMVSSFLSKT